MRAANNHNSNSALKRAVDGLKSVGREKPQALPRKLQETARKGLPCEFQFNQWNVRYLTKDKYGIFSLHWLVTNGISGRQKTLFTKDYIGAKGGVYWRRLAGDMRKV